jgi:phosphoglycerate dehydrogenase-like enzyme
MQRAEILITNQLIPEVIAEAEDRYRVTEAYGLPSGDLREVVGGYDALLCRSATKVTADVIAAGAEGNLEIITSATSGMDHVDIAAAEASDITVCHTPFTVTQANAEYNIGTIIALSRNLLAATRQVQDGGWDQQAVLGQEIGGRTLGLVGFGRIGQRTAQFAGNQAVILPQNVSTRKNALSSNTVYTVIDQVNQNNLRTGVMITVYGQTKKNGTSSAQSITIDAIQTSP